MEVSQLKIYSIGTVAANKLPSSKTIEVTPIEDKPMTDGEVTDNVSSYQAKSKDSSGAAYHVDVATTNTVKAEWLPIHGSNRMTAPDVRRGETVILYRFADSDKFYWATLKDDMRLRKLETVIYAFSATKDENQDTTAETSYFFEVSTHQKLIHVHTCKADGEPFAYDIQLNTAEGFFTIQDDAGNSIQLDSANRRLQMFNKDGSILDLNQKAILLASTDSIDLKSNLIRTNSQTLDQTTSSASLKASTNMIQAQTTHEGVINLAGDLAMSAGGGGSGSATIGGNMNVTGDVTAGGISSIHHVHEDAQGGTTSPPQ